jgi:hypothetical protein
MCPGRIDVRCVAEPELDVDRRGDPDQLGDLVQPDEAADVVRRLDVDVERAVDGRPDGGDLGEAEVSREVDRARAEVSEDAGGCRVGRGEHDRDLRLHVFREPACLAELRKGGEYAEVGDQHAAEAVLGRALRIVECLYDLLLPVGDRREDGTCRGPGHRGRTPAGVGAGEEADLDVRFGGAARPLVELGVGLQEDAAPLRDAVDPHVEPLRLLEHRVEAAWPLGARDLDPIVRPVGKALVRAR